MSGWAVPGWTVPSGDAQYASGAPSPPWSSLSRPTSSGASTSAVRQGGIVLLDVFLRRGSLAKSSAGATPFADARGDAGLEGGGWSAPAV